MFFLNLYLPSAFIGLISYLFDFKKIWQLLNEDVDFLKHALQTMLVIQFQLMQHFNRSEEFFHAIFFEETSYRIQMLFKFQIVLKLKSFKKQIKIVFE